MKKHAFLVLRAVCRLLVHVETISSCHAKPIQERIMMIVNEVIMTENLFLRNNPLISLFFSSSIKSKLYICSYFFVHVFPIYFRLCPMLFVIPRYNVQVDVIFNFPRVIKRLIIIIIIVVFMTLCTTESGEGMVGHATEKSPGNFSFDSCPPGTSGISRIRMKGVRQLYLL